MTLAGLVTRLRKISLNWRQPEFPANPLTSIPDGLTIRQLSQTGVTVVDNFCTAAEAQCFIDKARPRLGRSLILAKNQPGNTTVSDIRTSSSAAVLSNKDKDRQLIGVIERAAWLTGMRYQNAEPVYVHHYTEGAYYKFHNDFVGERYPIADRIHSVLVYLNSLDESQGGGTYFEQLNLEVRPKIGRAVFWANTNPDGTYNVENIHAALPLKGKESEKWVVQIFFRLYPNLGNIDMGIPSWRKSRGIPLTVADNLPDGVTMNEKRSAPR
jgi:hypothetical protein